MRWAFLIVGAVIGCVSGCTLLQSAGGAGAGGVGGGDAGPVCQGAQTTCMECVACALNSHCAALYAACQQSSDCHAIDQCFLINGCVDAACKQACYDGTPNGAAAYHAVNACIYCQQCPAACPGQCM